MKYVAVINYCSGCPVHEPSRYSKCKFFSTLDEVIREALAIEKDGFTIEDVYNCETQADDDLWVSYEYLAHSHSFIKFNFKDGSVVKYKPHEYKKDQWQFVGE